MTKLAQILGITLATLVLISCASKRSQEIGDPTVASPETKQHYQTIYDAFSRHDTNNDGFLDEHEFAQLQTDPNIVRMRQVIPELANSGPLMFNEVDEDGDGRISETEITVIIQPLIPQKQ
jgi:Ca2+-binding EF-hand superfamily protein